MKISIGDYRIKTDAYQFILEGKSVVQESKLAKEENIGKETWKVLGYYNNLEQILKAIPQRVLLDNDDLKTISRKLGIISIKIGAVKVALEKVTKADE